MDHPVGVELNFGSPRIFPVGPGRQIVATRRVLDEAARLGLPDSVDFEYGKWCII